MNTYGEITEYMRRAGDIMLGVYGKMSTVGYHVKPGDSNFVTETDVKVQRFLEENLSISFPGAEFFAEEEGQDERVLGDGLTFVIDPIDGTTNFMHDYAHSAILIALLENKSPVFGAIYNPYSGEMFSAEKGKGAYLNGKPIHVAHRPESQSVIAMGTSPYDTSTLGKRSCEIIYGVLSTFADIRRVGAASLDMCNTTTGRRDTFIENNISPWD